MLERLMRVVDWLLGPAAPAAATTPLVIPPAPPARDRGAPGTHDTVAFVAHWHYLRGLTGLARRGRSAPAWVAAPAPAWHLVEVASSGRPDDGAGPASVARREKALYDLWASLVRQGEGR